MSVVSLWYRFLYRTGLTPWESDTTSVSSQISALVSVEENGSQPPYGRALDLGCGTGRWSILLACRGWQVVGVDVVPKAIDAARRRAREADEDVAFATGDVTALCDTGVGSDFAFFLGCRVRQPSQRLAASGDGSGDRRHRRA